MPDGSAFGMDNPEYILNQRNGSGGRGNYHTLGIPLVNNNHPTSSSPSCSSGGGGGPSSLHSVNANSNGLPAPPNSAGLGGGGGIASRAAAPRSSSAEESDEHEYYNDLDRLKREMQPLHPNRAVNGLPPPGPPPPGPPPVLQQHQLPPPQGPAPVYQPPGLQPISKHETTV